AVRSSPAVQEVAAWQRAEREREHQLAEARQRLSDALERMPNQTPPSHPESAPPAPEAVSAQQSPVWIEWEDDAGELYGQWEDEQQVYWLDERGEWLRTEDRLAPEPEPQQRYSGPRMG